MRCKECGAPIHEGDATCTRCGSPVELEFQWNVYDFPKPRKTDDIDFDWGAGEAGRDTGATLEQDLLRELESIREADAPPEYDKFFTFNKKNEEFQQLLNREYEKFRGASPAAAMAAGLDPVAPVDPEDAPATEPEMVAAETTIEEPAAEPNIEVAVAETMIEEPAAEPVVEEVPAAEPVPLEPESPAEAPIILDDTTDEGDEPEVIAIYEPGPVPDLEGPAAHTGEPADQPEATAAELAEVDVPTTEPAPPEPPAPPLWFETVDEEPEPEPKARGGCVSRVLLILVILFLAAEVAALGIKYFWPESPAAAQVTQVQMVLSEKLDGLKDSVAAFIAGFGSGEEPGGPEGEGAGGTGTEGEGTEGGSASGGEGTADGNGGGPDTGTTGPDPQPAADKAELVGSLLGYNENIKTVRANDSLAFDSGADYPVADIAASKPIENNIWEQPAGADPKYYDREIVAVLIAFDSQWNAYVNEGDESVLALTREGSRAYRIVDTYSKVGKVKQEFTLLEIGEIRQGTEAFYVWAYEEIKEVEGAATNYKKYHWIYRIEPVDGAMKIADYYRY